MILRLHVYRLISARIRNLLPDLQYLAYRSSDSCMSSSVNKKQTEVLLSSVHAAQAARARYDYYRIKGTFAL
jgi:hypothetical protein